MAHFVTVFKLWYMCWPTYILLIGTTVLQTFLNICRSKIKRNAYDTWRCQQKYNTLCYQMSDAIAILFAKIYKWINLKDWRNIYLRVKFSMFLYWVIFFVYVFSASEPKNDSPFVDISCCFFTRKSLSNISTIVLFFIHFREGDVKWKETLCSIVILLLFRNRKYIFILRVINITLAFVFKWWT